VLLQQKWIHSRQSPATRSACLNKRRKTEAAGRSRIAPSQSIWRRVVKRFRNDHNPLLVASLTAFNEPRILFPRTYPAAVPALRIAGALFLIVEDDHMNILCMGGRTVGPAVAWDLVQTFLAAEFSQAQRHLRRLSKVASLETQDDCAKTIGREL
jgi:hypothetical protein